MSTTAPQPAQAPSAKRSRAWIWISVALAVVCAGLLIWALMTRSDLNDTQSDLDQTNQQVADLQKQVDQGKDSGGALVTAAKTAYDALAQQLGVTNTDLASQQQAVTDAQKTADQAQQAADQAQQDLSNAQDKAKAQLDKAQADLDAAKSKGTVAANCAKAYISALGSLFDGNNLASQASAVAQQISSITDDCKAAFASS